MKIEIKKGDHLVLQEIENLLNVIVEEVTEIQNPNIEDKEFQVKTKNLDFDFSNFYNLIHVIKKEDAKRSSIEIGRAVSELSLIADKELEN